MKKFSKKVYTLVYLPLKPVTKGRNRGAHDAREFVADHFFIILISKHKLRLFPPLNPLSGNGVVMFWSL